MDQTRTARAIFAAREVKLRAREAGSRSSARGARLVQSHATGSYIVGQPGTSNSAARRVNIVYLVERHARVLLPILKSTKICGARTERLTHARRLINRYNYREKYCCRCHGY